jgi:hypothetical protein
MAYEERYDTTEEHLSGMVGWVGFAGVMMILGGMFQAIAGLVAIFQNAFFAVNTNQLIVIHNIHAWGWVNLVFGSIVILAGISLFSGATWARAIAVILAMLSAVTNLVSITLYPFWSLIMISVSILVIYSVIVHGGELRE